MTALDERTTTAPPAAPGPRRPLEHPRLRRRPGGRAGDRRAARGRPLGAQRHERPALALPRGAAGRERSGRAPGRRSTTRSPRATGIWADRAPVLILAVAQTTNEDGSPRPVAAYELGLAVSQLTTQAHADGLHVHQMGGFDADVGRQALGVPAEFTPYVVIAVGRRGSDDHLPEFLRDREAAPRERRPLSDLAFAGTWGRPRPTFARLGTHAQSSASDRPRPGRSHRRPEGEAVPTYQYVCTECGEPLEAVQSFTDAALTTCPACGGQLRKVFSAVGVVFKGSGFYRNDSRHGLRLEVGQRARAATARRRAATARPRSRKGDSGRARDEVVRRASRRSDGSSSGPSPAGDPPPSPAAPAPPPEPQR